VHDAWLRKRTALEQQEHRIPARAARCCGEIAGNLHVGIRDAPGKATTQGYGTRREPCWRRSRSQRLICTSNASRGQTSPGAEALTVAPAL